VSEGLPHAKTSLRWVDQGTDECKELTLIRICDKGSKKNLGDKEGMTGNCDDYLKTLQGLS